MKGGICLSAIGYIQVHAYTSNAQIPLKDVAVTVSDLNGSGIAMRLTNRSGILDTPIQITVPNRSESQTPQQGSSPFTSVNLYARTTDYEEIDIKNLQVFADTVTVQNLEMIPLAEFPGAWNNAEVFDTATQNL